MLFRRFVDNTNASSTASRLRAARFSLLREIIGDRRSVSVLDIGGRPNYWDMMLRGSDLADRLHLTLVNLERFEGAHERMTLVTGDARSLPEYGDGQFDVVYSNSTIEHVGSLEDQRSMAREVQRIGKAFCVQTPNRYFPIEPHFVFPMFQFLPLSTRASLLQHFNLGWMKRTPERAEAIARVSEIRLMTLREVRQLFPGANVFEEQYLGLTKSFVAYKRM